MAVLLHYYHRLVSYVLKASSHGLAKVPGETLVKINQFVLSV